MSILFNGYYGQKNTGDDIFCVIAEWGALKFWEQDKFRFFGRDLPLSADNSSLRSGKLKKKYIKGQELLEILVAAGMSSKVIFAGGSLFHSEIDTLSVKNIIGTYAKLGVIQTGAVGVSVGPYRSKEARKSIKSFLNQFLFLAVRDRRSYEEAVNMQLDIPLVEAFDLAALLPRVYPLEKTANKKPTLGVSICNYERYISGNVSNEERRNRKIFKSLDLLAKKVPDLEIKVLIFNAHPQVGDISISERLINGISPKVHVQKIPYRSNPIHMWREISSCDAILATRLHAGMFSCFSKTPFLQVEYHKKCGDFLHDINYPEEFRIGDIEVSCNEVCEKITELLNLQSPFLKGLDKIERKAERNFTDTKEFLS